MAFSLSGTSSRAIRRPPDDGVGVVGKMLPSISVESRDLDHI